MRKVTFAILLGVTLFCTVNVGFWMGSMSQIKTDTAVLKYRFETMLTTTSQVSESSLSSLNASVELVSLLSNVSVTLRNIISNEAAYWNKKQHEILSQMDKDEFKNAGAQCSKETVSTVEGFNSYPEQFKEFVYYSHCRQVPIIINQPTKCKLNPPFLLLAIKSEPYSFVRRQAVRETWGKEMVYDGLQVHTVFILGSSFNEFEPNMQSLLNCESETYKDILQWDFKDSFFNLTLKENLLLKWIIDFCPDVAFVFKGDDDIFANPLQIVRHLYSLDKKKAKNLYMGQVVTYASPMRERKSKYYIPDSFYKGGYPPYAAGAGFVFSGHLARWMYLVSYYIPFFPIDDVYTGWIMIALGVPAQLHPQFQTFDIAEKDRLNPCVHKQLFIVHQRSPQHNKQLWKAIQDPGLQC
ncbi:N-acetyllactosaminide beta-1,3-N-acetylglucosaminyltransferase 2-like [Protopterus annectens]|uniref:N-acetyllactosaminide beta-1,3-N-acetylglucosaminyltransferase 2-like n=1 Tax=Protopterus annectens TaxID=7888 RepID=UPI001CFA00A5|nr:N-acetyllactosaminide beta-1,3-N-acetylglucosaminyltransferase 2-like [Protopterus annectens]